MVRQVETRDIPTLAKLWYAEKPKTCFNKLDIEWSELRCAEFLAEQRVNLNGAMFISEINGQIVAAIGINISDHFLPPYPRVMNEWMWLGSNKREVVKVFQAAKEYGRQHGATLFTYVLNVPGQSATKFTETYRWEVL
jgi:hypothetical protein